MRVSGGRDSDDACGAARQKLVRGSSAEMHAAIAKKEMHSSIAKKEMHARAIAKKEMHAS